MNIQRSNSRKLYTSHVKLMSYNQPKKENKQKKNNDYYNDYNNYSNWVEKRTPVERFLNSLNKKPNRSRMNDIELEMCTSLRFGSTAGLRDERVNRCPFRGLHNTSTTKYCTCKHHPFEPTPLHQVTKIIGNTKKNSVSLNTSSGNYDIYRTVLVYPKFKCHFDV